MLCHILPRLPEQVTRIRFVKKFSFAGDNETGTKCFLIRKEKVLEVLRWLKTYNKEYQDIVIEEQNLAWLGDSKEAELPVEGESYDKCIYLDEDSHNSSCVDQGPSPTTVNEENSIDSGKCYGYFDKQHTSFPSSDQICVSRVIQTALSQGNLKNEVSTCLVIILCFIIAVIVLSLWL